MCWAFSTLIELTQTGKLSEVEYKSLVERCVKHLKFRFRLDETQRNVGRLFLHEHPRDAWSRGLSFVNELAELCVHKTKGDLCRFQLATNSIEKGSWFMSNSECIIEELRMRCYSGGGQAQNHMKNFVVAVLKGLEREIDSAKEIRSMEVGVTCEEPNVLELDEHAEELQNVFDNISGVRRDSDLLSALRKVEIDFMNRLDVYRKRPRNGATDKGGIQVEIVRERTQTLGPDHARNVRIDGTARVRDVLTFRSSVVRRLGRSCSWTLPGRTVRLKGPVRWRLSCRLKSK